MKKNILLLLVLLALVKPVSAQQIDVDSIVKVVSARNTGKTHSLTVNADSLLKQLPLTNPGAQRVDLIYSIFNVFANDKQNIEMGYRVLAWAKAHNDQISIAVIASEMGTVFSATGDKGTGSQLESEALAAAKQSGDNEALGIVFQNSFARADYTEPQLKYYALKALKYSMEANDMKRVSWDYTDLGEYYEFIKKTDSSLYYYRKSLDWAIRANSVFDICSNLYRIGYLQKDDRLKQKYLQYSFRIAKLTNNPAAIAKSATMLGKYYFGKNNIGTALAYASRAYQTSLKLTTDFSLPPAELISKIYYKQRNIDSAVKYTEIYYQLREQLNNNESMVRAQAAAFAEKQKQQKADTEKSELQNIQQRWVLGLVIVFLLLLAFIFWRNNRLSRKSNILLKHQKQQTELALTDLKAAQNQLIQSEKMASLGELTAGIAHEIQNPLNFVNNFSEVNDEMIDELKEELKQGRIKEALSIADDIQQNEKKINHHGKRADSIVKGMLEHSRASSGARELTDLNSLANEYLALAYHGLRAKDKSFNADLVTNFDINLPKVNLVQQEMGRVLLNLFNNAFYAVNKKADTMGQVYKPEVKIITKTGDKHIIISVRDNGTGIPDAIKDKIMQPFFTTKPTGQGTGLGLSLSYDIVVKGHGGNIRATSEEGQFTQIDILIPI